MVGPSVKREAVAHLMAVSGLSERRACSLVDADRKMVRYKSRRPPDTELRVRLRDLANERRRFGIPLSRQAIACNCRKAPALHTVAAEGRVFRRFVLLCKKLDLFGRELLAVDGTRIKAVNNKDRNFTRNSLQTFIKVADGRLADYMKRLDDGDAVEKATGGARVENLAEKIEGLRKKRGEYDAMQKNLERAGAEQISLPIPTAGRWRRTRASPSATTSRSRLTRRTR